MSCVLKVSIIKKIILELSLYSFIYIVLAFGAVTKE